MIRSLLWVVLALLQGNVKPEPRYFRYERPVIVPAGTPVGPVCTVVDPLLWTHASRRLADVRLYQGDREIPYALPKSAGFTQTPQPAIVRNLGIRNGHVVFDVQLSQPVYNTLSIETTAKNFVASVVVSGSRSDDRRETRIGTFTIFDLTGQHLPRSTVLHLPESNFTYLHIEIIGAIKTDEITGVTVLDTAEYAPVYTVVAESRVVQQQGKSSVVHFLVPGRVPVDRVEIVPASSAGNFLRYVHVEWRAGGARTSIAGSDAVYRIHMGEGTQRIDRDKYTLDVTSAISDSGDVQWNVAVDNADDPPLALNAVRLAMVKRLLCFDAVPAETYVIRYGDSALAPPRYDYATLYRSIETPVMAQVGEERKNVRIEARPDARPWSERHPVVLWVVLLGVVVVLGGVAVRTAKRT
jgi:hypothetical protein